jgi:zinc/manganese transport system substrate-binding protein
MIKSRTYYLAVAVMVAIVAAWALLSGSSGGSEESAEKGLLIVVTFPNLRDDVRLLTCKGDKVVALVPPGADPHQFQLTPQAVETVKKADLIISTGHAPFELKLRDIVSEDKLIEIPRINGIKLLRNPVTGQPNYHMPIYDPSNYRVFVKYVAEKLGEARPDCRDVYRRNAEKVITELNRLVQEAPRLDLIAVGSAPPVQYAVSWLGLKVEWLLSPEHGVPPSPSGIEKARELLREGAVAVIMETEGGLATVADRKLLELAEATGSPVMRIPPPYAPGPVIDKLRAVVESAKKLGER